MQILDALIRAGKVEISQFVVENSGTMNYNNYHHPAEKQESVMTPPTPDQLAKAILMVQQSCWANSSYAVLYCVCRDCFDYKNRSEFERTVQMLPFDTPPSFTCTDGVVTSTFNDNKYMALPISKWDQVNVPKRVLKLADDFQKALHDVTKK